MQGDTPINDADFAGRIYAIGDIHGRADLLADLLDLIRKDAAGADRPEIVCLFLGDYIDRGKKSAETLDCLTGDPLPGVRCGFLKGNHEDMMIRFLNSGKGWESWLYNGGETTLESYGLEPDGLYWEDMPAEQARCALDRVLPPSHRAFLSNLPLWARLGGYFFAHAGVRPGRPLAGQDPRDLMWIREAFLESDQDHGAVVVHGHTPTHDARPEVRANRINVDTGAYRSGRLTCVVLEGHKRRFLNT